MPTIAVSFRSIVIVRRRRFASAYKSFVGASDFFSYSRVSVKYMLNPHINVRSVFLRIVVLLKIRQIYSDKKVEHIYF